MWGVEHTVLFSLSLSLRIWHKELTSFLPGMEQQ